MHESTTDTISTNGDYSVFVNQPKKDFVLKLTLTEADSSQMRIVELSSIFDEERNKASYGKLVDRIVAAVGYDIKTTALKLTYQDFEDDAVVISSTQELTYAIRQFYDKGMMKFVCSVQRETQINKIQHANETAGDAKKLIVEFPFPTIRFDPSRATPGLTLANDNRQVTKTESGGSWKCIYLMDGITSGYKYWSFKIVAKSGPGNMMIGVSDSSFSLTHNYPGTTGMPGCSLNLANGYTHYNGRSVASANASRVPKATIIGVLVDMNHKTVTFFADGEHVSTVGADTNVLTTGREYFLVVSLLTQGQCVEVMDLVPPISH